MDENEINKVKQQWIREQCDLKKQLITEDVACWFKEECAGNEKDEVQLQFVGGVDISFVKEDETHACAALVILSYPELKVVYEDYGFVHLTQPYIPEFLAFREASFLQALVCKLKKDKPEFIPEVIFVDGNGILHPRGFGVASHLGVITDMCTIGVAKTLFLVDGLEKNTEHLEKIHHLKEAGDSFFLIGNSAAILGAALRSTDTSKNPIYVSIGHKISLETSLKLTSLCCRHRVPEPIRQADIRSREFLRKHYDALLETCGCETVKKRTKDEQDIEESAEKEDKSMWNWCSVL